MMTMKSTQMMTTKNKTIIGACPECDANIIFNKAPFLGQKKVCPECREKLEVIGLNPIELDWDYDDSDNDDDYGDDYGDDDF